MLRTGSRISTMAPASNSSVAPRAWPRPKVAPVGLPRWLVGPLAHTRAPFRGMRVRQPVPAARVKPICLYNIF